MLLKHLECPETAPTTNRQSSRPSAGARASAAGRVLIVDDDPDIRRDYSEALIRAGYRVDSAEECEAEWRLLDATSRSTRGYDLVITNNLPQACDPEQVRPAHCAPMTLLVVLTHQAGHEHSGHIRLAAILPRPFDPAQLLERVGTILRDIQGANIG
jgi:two-component system, OmpR family, response regulator